MESLGAELYRAACSDKVASIPQLISHGADLKWRHPGDGTTALHAACERGHAEVAQLLLRKGAPADIKREDGTTPLFISCWLGQTDIVRMLLSAGAQVDQMDNAGMTPLWVVCCIQAFYQIKPALIRALLDAKANPMHKVQAWAPLDLAKRAMGISWDIIELLEKSGAAELEYSPAEQKRRHVAKRVRNFIWDRFDRPYSNPLYGWGYGQGSLGAELYRAACIPGLVGSIPQLISRGADLKFRHSQDGVTALHAACERGHAEVVQLLLDSGAPADIEREDGMTPLFASCWLGRTDIVRMLLAAGAQVGQMNNAGMTPLWAFTIETHMPFKHDRRHLRVRTIEGISSTIEGVERTLPQPVLIRALLDAKADPMHEIQGRSWIEHIYCSIMEIHVRSRVHVRSSTEPQLEELTKLLTEYLPAGLAEQDAQRAADAALLEEQWLAIKAETNVKLTTARAAADVCMAERAAERAAEQQQRQAVEREEQRQALLERKSKEQETVQQKQKLESRRAEEEEARLKAQLKEKSEAKKRDKLDKKEKKKSLSPFVLQAQQEQLAREERLADEARAAELAAKLALQEQERQAATSYEHHAEAQREAEAHTRREAGARARREAEAAARRETGDGRLRARLEAEARELREVDARREELRASKEAEAQEAETRRLEVESVRFEQERWEAQTRRREAEDSTAPAAPAVPAAPSPQQLGVPTNLLPAVALLQQQEVAAGSWQQQLLGEAHDAEGLNELSCPITCELMQDPVVAADGMTYEKVAIERWLESHGTSPMTGEALEHKFLNPNLFVRGKIHRLQEAEGAVLTGRTSSTRYGGRGAGRGGRGGRPRGQGALECEV